MVGNLAGGSGDVALGHLCAGVNARFGNFICRTAMMAECRLGVRSLVRSVAHARPLGAPMRRLSAAASSGAAPARVAVVGAGWWSQGWHLPQLHRNPDSQLCAIVEPSETLRSTLNPDMETRAELGARYGCPVYASVEELAGSGVALDGVVVASSHHAHFEAGVAAMENGWHVLMEKPMATEVEQATEMARLAAQRPELSFMVNNTANWRDNSKRAVALVQEGKIGTVEHVNCYMGSPLNWLFNDPANVGWVTPTGSMQGNGFAWGQLSHTLAWVYKVTGLTPARVFAFMGYSKTTPADLYDSATVMCTNGETISVQGVATLPGESPVASKQIDNKVFGTEGGLFYGGDDAKPESGDLVVRRHDGEEIIHPGFEFENYEAEGIGPESLLAFVAACRGQPHWNGCDAVVGAKTVATIEAMYRSVAEDRVAEVAELEQ